MLRKVASGLLLSTLVMLPNSSHANGYKILAVKSAKATAMGEAFIVQADDPSTVAFNPAGLPKVTNTQMSLQLTLCNAYTSYESPTGQKTDNEPEWQAIPGFFVASDFGTGRFGAGLGLSFPNGLSSKWGEDSFARYVATYSSLTVADLSPAVGYKVNDHLKIGGGINFYYSKARLENMLDMGLLMGVPGGADTRSILKGDGTAWGCNVGAIYDFNERHGVAITWHKPYSIDYDGEISIGDMTADTKASIDFPGVVVIGYAYRPMKQLKLEFNLDWTDWKDVDDISVHPETPLIPDSLIQQNLHNTLAYKFGAEYLYSANLALRCGYIYNENATPDETWRPSMPDTDMHFFLAGFGYTYRNVTIDVAAQLVWYEERTIENNVDLNEFRSSSSIDGTYKTWAPCLSMGATYRF